MDEGLLLWYDQSRLILDTGHRIGRFLYVFDITSSSPTEGTFWVPNLTHTNIGTPFYIDVAQGDIRGEWVRVHTWNGPEAYWNRTGTLTYPHRIYIGVY